MPRAHRFRGLAGLLLTACLLHVNRPAVAQIVGYSDPLSRSEQGKPLVPFQYCEPLLKLLAAGKVEEFNRLRESPVYAGSYLELSSFRSHQSSLRLDGLDLTRIDLSRCILQGDFLEGTNLNRADLRESYLAETYFGGPLPLRENVTELMARPTSMRGADFTGAILKVDEGPDSLGGTRQSWARLDYVDATDAIGLPSSALHRTQALARAALGRPQPQGWSFFAGHGEERVSADAVGTRCENPFKIIAPRFYPRWASFGYDVAKLATLRALRVTDHGLPEMGCVVNSDPKTVLVIADPFVSLTEIYSVGPVVVTGYAQPNNLYADNVVWLRDSVFPRGLIFGKPILIEQTVKRDSGSSVLSEVHGDDFGGPPAQPDPYLTHLLRAETIADVAKTLGNFRWQPLPKPWERPASLESVLSREQRAELLQRHPQIRGWKAVAVAGAHSELDSDEVVNADPRTVLILGAGFSSSRSVFSAGPVIAVGGDTLRNVLSQQWVEVLGHCKIDDITALQGIQGKERNDDVKIAGWAADSYFMY